MTKLKEYDLSYSKLNAQIVVAGFDEAGRGPLCGPVVCAGVVLKREFDSIDINDSKKLTDKQRRKAYQEIIDNSIFYDIEIISNKIIDKINILEASRLGMQLALDKMMQANIKVDILLTDYMKLKNTYGLSLYPLKKGDATSLNIAASSILAKVTRDDIMLELDKKYPQYELSQNKGYPTKRHLELLEKYGVIEDIYRLTYKPVREILEPKLF